MKAFLLIGETRYRVAPPFEGADHALWEGE